MPPGSEVGINQSLKSMENSFVYKSSSLGSSNVTQVMKTPVMITSQKHHMGGSYLLR